ncbi:MAG: sigma 54-interacting transcriptional regulator [Candidatus Krumholzibacteriota bacterium]|nr:sigma 54-interacting transcriptional regulator [Candidatus Krumholzibacteriota bacterium]
MTGHDGDPEDRPEDSEARAPRRSPALERLLQERGRAATGRPDGEAEAPPLAGSPASGPATGPAAAESAPAGGETTLSVEWELERARAALAAADDELAGLRGIREAYDRLVALLDANADLLVSGDARRLPGRILEIALDLVGADRAAFFRFSAGGALRPSLVHPEGTAFSAISRSVVRDALIEKRSILYQGRSSREGMERQSVLDLDLETVVATPLMARERLLGILYLDGARAGRFGSADLPALETFSRLAAAAMLRLEELQQARAEKRQLEEENRELKSVLGDETRLGGILAAGDAMRRILDQIRRMSRYRSTVRIYGETGTGKELVARALHQESPWADKAFVAVNCGAIPETLLEAELFGHEKGAFTGADQARAGLFEEADGGTLFLDEIGDMSAALQVKLLRVLETGEVRRLGSSRSHRVDVRIIAASHHDLQADVREGRFRDDLFYRLNVLTISLPPLRERPEDVALLTEHFLDVYAERLGRPRPRLSAPALRRLQTQAWPGNVRQLEKCIERSLALWEGDGSLAAGDLVLDEGLPVPAAAGDAGEAPRGDESLKDYLARLERAKIRQALDLAGGRVTAAAAALGISRQYLHRKIRDLERKRSQDVNGE